MLSLDSIFFEKLDKIIIGVCGGDGIGPYISKVAKDFGNRGINSVEKVEKEVDNSTSWRYNKEVDNATFKIYNENINKVWR